MTISAFAMVLIFPNFPQSFSSISDHYSVNFGFTLMLKSGTTQSLWDRSPDCAWPWFWFLPPTSVGCLHKEAIVCGMSWQRRARKSAFLFLSSRKEECDCPATLPMRAIPRKMLPWNEFHRETHYKSWGLKESLDYEVRATEMAQRLKDTFFQA